MRQSHIIKEIIAPSAANQSVHNYCSNIIIMFNDLTAERLHCARCKIELITFFSVVLSMTRPRLYLFTLVLKSPYGEWPITYTFTFTFTFAMD